MATNSQKFGRITRRVLLHVATAATLAAAALSVPACGGGEVTTWEGPPKSDAEAAYREALAKLESGQISESQTLFNALRLKYPYQTRWTTLAELRMADALLEQGRFTAAAESYSQFINSHPTHAEVPYAQYRIGVCYYEQMPTDFFIFPEPWQRELDSARQAEGNLRRFLRGTKEGPFVEDAKTKLTEVQDRLARHQLYAAEFYMDREAWLGAVNRLTTLLERYPESQIAPDGLMLMANALIRENDVRAAAAALTKMVADYPESEHVPAAQSWLAQNGLGDTPPMQFKTP